MSKYINVAMHIISGLLFIAVGILYIIRNYTFYSLSFKLIGILILISSGIKLINILLKRKKIITNILDIFINITLGIFFIAKPKLFIYISTKIFAPLDVLLVVQAVGPAAHHGAGDAHDQAQHRGDGEGEEGFQLLFLLLAVARADLADAGFAVLRHVVERRVLKRPDVDGLLQNHLAVAVEFTGEPRQGRRERNDSDFYAFHDQLF